MENKRPIANIKLNKTDFFDVYGISLLNKKLDLSDDYVISLLLPIADKYFQVTYQALTAELRYFLNGGQSGNIGWKDLPFYQDNNRTVLKRMKIKNWKTHRKQLTISQIYRCFHEGEWEGGYGGEAWANIALACKGLQNVITGKNIEYICLAIDRLNDLEHNNSLYLATYTSFNLYEALEYKVLATEAEILRKCSCGVQELQKFLIKD